MIKSLGIISTRNKFDPSIRLPIKDLSRFCEEIDILKCRESELDDLSNLVDVDLRNEVDLEDSNPEWVIHLYDDEILSRRMDYMYNSLVMNPYVNTWTSKIRFMWDAETYRVDKLWDSFEVPFMWRYIPEIKYEFENDMPTNQPGPVERSYVDILSYRYSTEINRLNEYVKFLHEKKKYNRISQMHYNSIVLDEDLKLERLIDE